MGHDAKKLELIQWLSKSEYEETLDFLEVEKDSSKTENDWWHMLTPEQKTGIERLERR